MRILGRDCFHGAGGDLLHALWTESGEKELRCDTSPLSGGALAKKWNKILTTKENYQLCFSAVAKLA